MKQLSLIVMGICAITLSTMLWSLTIASKNGLSPTPTQFSEYLQEDFQQYLEETRAWIKQHREFRSDDHAFELSVNAPYELKPSTVARKGVLLIHGLSDSPYAFVDIAARLQKEGVLVRTVLLPGHGAKPVDLKLPTLDQWLELISHHIKLLQREVDDVWIGGFSTGANLALIEAANNPAISGTLLFSPAISSRKPLDFLAPYAKHLMDWADKDPEVSITRFESLTMNGAALFYQSSYLVRELLDDKPYTQPVFIGVSEHDSVVNVERIYQYFNDTFINPNNRFLWLGERQFDASNALSYSMHLPEQRIISGSHMSLLYAPDNPLYGEQGSIRICNNGQSQEKEDACNAGQTSWFSAFDHSEGDHIYARLTWNPYFEETMQAMMKVINATN